MEIFNTKMELKWLCNKRHGTWEDKEEEDEKKAIQLNSFCAIIINMKLLIWGMQLCS